MGKLANIFSGSVIGEASVLIKPLTKNFGSELEKGTKASFGKFAAFGGAAIAGVGALLTKHGRDLQQADIALKRVIENSGRSWEDYEDRVDAATKTQARFGHNAADTREALSKLALTTKDPDVAFKSLGVTADLAALKNISLSEAATLVGRAYAGNQKLLTQFGITGIRAKDITLDLEKATNANTSAVQRLNSAQRNLRDLEAQIADRRKKSLSDRQRERDAEQGIQRTQKRGTEAIADAQEHLADVEADLAQQGKRSLSDEVRLREARQRVIKAQSRVQERGIEELIDAQEHLADVEADLASKTERDLSDDIRLREAQQAIVKAQESATEDLTDAEQNLSDVHAEFADRQKLSISETQSLRDARLELSQAQAEAARTSADLAASQKQTADAAAAGATNLAALESKIGGLAGEQAATAIGKLDGIKTALENIAARAGQDAGPAILAVGSALGSLGGIASGVAAIKDLKLTPAIGRLAAAAGAAGLTGVVIGLAAGFSLLLVKGLQETGEWVDKLLADHFPRLNAFLTGSVGPVLDGIKQKFDDLTGQGKVEKPGILTPFLKDFFKPTPVKRHSGGKVPYGLPSFQTGGEVPILAQSGEFVMSRKAVNRLGLATMEAINQGRAGGGGGGTTVVVPVMLDSREIARVIAGPVTDEQIRQNRGNSSIFGGKA